MSNSRLVGLLGGAAALTIGGNAFAAIIGVTLGTSGPPSGWAGHTYTPFPVDARAVGQMVKDVPSPLGGDIVFESDNFKGMDKREKREVAPADFGDVDWGHGYTGSVYHDYNFTPVTSLTLVLPSGTESFYFYLQSNVAGPHTFTVTAGGEVALVEPDVDASAGAIGFIFSATDGDTIQSIQIDSDVTFAVGEFGISNTPEPSCLGIIGMAGVLLTRRLRKS